MICNMDCFNCIYIDCINDAEPTEAERQAQDDYDRFVVTDRLKEQARFKGHMSQWKYNHSAKGKAAQKRYFKTDKGKEAERRHKQKQIASGKNAEYCRRYYARKKGLAI